MFTSCNGSAVVDKKSVYANTKSERIPFGKGGLVRGMASSVCVGRNRWIWLSTLVDFSGSERLGNPVKFEFVGNQLMIGPFVFLPMASIPSNHTFCR